MHIEVRLAGTDMKMWRSVFVLPSIMVDTHVDSSVMFIKLTVHNMWKVNFIAVNVPEA
jgi:hypothetical protein